MGREFLMVGIISFYRDVSLSTSAFTPVAAETFLDGLLDGETDGFAIDATDYDDLIPAAYVGGPVGGDVLVGASGVPSYDHVPLDASNLVNSGTSPKMVHNASSPYVRWSAHNLALQSQTFDNAAWTKNAGTSITADNTTAPDGTSTADLLTHTANENVSAASAITVVAGFNYTISVYAKPNSTNHIRLACGDAYPTTDTVGCYFNVSTGAVGTTSATNWTNVSQTITDAGSGWYRCSIQFTVVSDTTAYPHFRCANADNSAASNGNTAWFWGLQVNRGPIATPYLATTTAARMGIPQSYDPYEDCYGILVEPAGTNGNGNSEILGGYGNNNITVATNDTTAPDGTTTADKLTANAGSAAHNLFNNAFTTNGTAASSTSSVYVKSSTAQYVMVGIVNGSTTWVVATYDLTGESVTQGSAGAGATYQTASITAVGGGWYRLTVTGICNATNFFVVGIVDTGTPTHGSFGDVTWTAAGTEAIWAWGAQYEVSAVATSYIPTLGSTVTRAVDAVNAPTSSLPFSATAGTFTAFGKTFLIDTTNGNMMLNFDNNTSDERVSMAIGTTGTGGVSVLDGGVGQAVINSSNTISNDTAFMVATSWAVNDFAVCLNAGTVVTDTSGTLPTVTTLTVGHRLTSGPIRLLNGYIYQARYLPRAASDVELQ
jgi:hypothetical protein